MHRAWTRADIRRLRAGFDDRTLPGKEFSHAAHIAVGTTYVCELGRGSALRRLREAIPLYNVAQGGENSDSRGYHETLTRFWVDRLAEFLETVDSALSVEERALLAVKRFGGTARLDRNYYTFDVLASVEARRAWMPPDRLPPGVPER